MKDTNIGSVTASDVDAGAILEWTVVDGLFADTFAIESTTGVIKFVGPTASLDPTTKAEYDIEVTVSDGLGGVATVPVTLAVVDANDAPTITNAAETRRVPENSPKGRPVGASLTATDPEGDTVTFRIESGNDNGAFALNAVTGQLTVNTPAALDHEQAATQTIKIVAVDDGRGFLESFALVTIIIDDVNEAPAIPDATVSVEELSGTGTVVDTVLFSDVDDGDSVIVSITSGNVGGAFALHPTTGVLTVARGSAINFETLSQYRLSVLARDGSGLTDTATVTVDIIDVNDAPVLVDQTRAIAENSVAGALVGKTLPAMDDDLARGQRLSFEITAGNVGGAFAVADDGQLTVATPSAVNYETRTVFDLVVKVSDSASPAKSTTAKVRIDVLDVNERPVFPETSYSAEVNENSPPGTPVGAAPFVASDPEVAYQTVSYSIAGESAFFTINPSTGALSVRRTGLDHESRSSYDLTIIATDSALPALEGKTQVTVTVADVNEAPVIHQAVRDVDENSPAGTLIGAALPASDVDDRRTTAPSWSTPLRARPASRPCLTLTPRRASCRSRRAPAWTLSPGRRTCSR